MINQIYTLYKGEKLIQGTANDKKILEFYRKLKKKISSKFEKLERFLRKRLAKIDNILLLFIFDFRNETIR